MNKSDFLNESHRQQKDASRLLTDPLSAFIAADRPDKIPLRVQLYFAGVLNARCAHRRWLEMATLSGQPVEAFAIFTGHLRKLVESWVPFAPDAIAWGKAHPDLYESIIGAQLQRRTAIALPDILTEHSQRAAGGAPMIIVLSKLYGQSSYEQAAETAAYVLFGDFLAGDPRSIRFCARQSCRKPFRPRKSNKVFHDPACGRTVSSNRVHKAEIRAENRRKLRAYASRLAKWIKRPKGDWLDAVEADKRKRRLLTTCIQAAQPDSPEARARARARVLERCFDVHRISCQEEGEVDGFLSAIQEANELKQQGRLTR